MAISRPSLPANKRNSYRKMTKRTYAILIFYLLAGSFFVSSLLFVAKKYSHLVGGLASTQGKEEKLLLPLPLTHPNVARMELQYFVRGEIKDIKKDDGRTEIILSDSVPPFPQIFIMPETRLWKISPPFAPSDMRQIAPDDLNPKMRIEFYINYDIATQRWIIRDIFVPEGITN